MVHLAPLPGTPYYDAQSFEHILNTAARSARALQRGGAHGCLVQTADRVYTADDSSDPARTVAAGLIVRAIAEATGPEFTIGVQLMRNAVKASLAVAYVAGGRFIRATALVGSTPADHGTLHADPYEAMAYRRFLSAQHIQIIADIASIHHHPSRAVGELARHARRVGADAVTVGTRDESRTLAWLSEIRREAPGLPIFLAGHTNHDNADRLLAKADGAFVGTCLESGGWGGVIEEDRVKSYMEIVHALPPLAHACSR